MNIQVTKHASQQLGFLYTNGINISESEVLQAVRRCYRGTCYETIKVKRVPLAHIDRPDYTFKYVEGDLVVAVVRNGRITTVLLRKSWSKSKNYKIGA